VSYPNLNAALDWLVAYLQADVPENPLAQLAIYNVWNNATPFGVRRLLGPPLEVTEVRIAYLSGRTHEGVILVSTNQLNQNFGSIQQKRFPFDVTLDVTLYARYDGDEGHHQDLAAALNERLLTEAVGNLGHYARRVAPQPLGGELPRTDLRVQTVRTTLLTTLQALIE